MGTEAVARRRAWMLSFRVSLAVAIPALVVAVGSVIAVRTYVRTRAAVRTLSESIFVQVAEQAGERTRGYLDNAVPALDVLTALSEGEQRAGAYDSVIGRKLWSTLRAHRSFSWVSYGDARGTFGGAFRTPDGALHYDLSTMGEGGAATLEERALDDSGRSQPARTRDNQGYDPRLRPWYRAALAGSTHAWTAPYVFHTRPVVGISCVRALRSPEGAVAGVYSVDFELDAVSRFVAQLRPSPNSVVFVYTREGEVIAHPTLSVVAHGASASPQLLRLADVREPSVRDFRAALGGRDVDGRGHRHVRFQSGATMMLGSVARLPIEGSLEWRVAVLAPERDFMGSLERENRATLLVGAVSVLAAMALGLFLASRVARPIDALRREMELVGQFRLEDRPPVETVFTEVDAMARSLESMKSGIASFARFVPRDVVRAVLASGRQAELGGEVRTLSVVFSDLAGFTTLAESMEPDALVRTLGGYLDAMTNTLSDGGGTVDKFIGDGIMSFWNAPLDDAHHARRACIAALACQRALRALSNDPSHAWVANTKTRIGVATGEVVVGNVGTPERMNYTAMGDAVNLSARLESLNKQYGTVVMAAESTVVHARDSVLVRPIDVVAVQGKAQGVKVYELMALVSEASDAQRALAALCEEALERYLARSFEAAAERWGKALEIAPADQVATLMRERALRFVHEPPPANWSGVFMASGK